MININNIDHMIQLIEKETFPLFYLSRPACGVCGDLKPQFEKMSHQIQGIKAYYINLDEHEDIAGQFSVFTIPGVLVYAQGKEILREARNFSIEDIRSRLERVAELMFS